MCWWIDTPKLWSARSLFYIRLAPIDRRQESAKVTSLSNHLLFLYHQRSIVTCRLIGCDGWNGQNDASRRFQFNFLFQRECKLLLALKSYLECADCSTYFNLITAWFQSSTSSSISWLSYVMNLEQYLLIIFLNSTEAVNIQLFA